MKTHLAEPDGHIIHHGPVTAGVGKRSCALSGNGCGSLSWVMLAAMLHSSRTGTQSKVSESVFVLKGQAKLSI